MGRAIYMQFIGTIPAHDNYKEQNGTPMGILNKQIKEYNYENNMK